MTTTDTSTAPEPKTRTITLSDRPPVKIREDEWPVIARGSGKSRVSYHTPIPVHEVDCYELRVRRHADGRTLVYGVLNASPAWTGSEDRSAGVLLIPPGVGPLTVDDGRVVADDVLVNAIREVGAECGLPDSVIRDCIADLPAVEL